MFILYHPNNDIISQSTSIIRLHRSISSYLSHPPYPVKTLSVSPCKPITVATQNGKGGSESEMDYNKISSKILEHQPENIWMVNSGWQLYHVLLYSKTYYVYFAHFSSKTFNLFKVYHWHYLREQATWVFPPEQLHQAYLPLYFFLSF